MADHSVIVHALRKENGYGGIGRGFALNKLYTLTYKLLYEQKVKVYFFYIAGPLNPADSVAKLWGYERESSVCAQSR